MQQLNISEITPTGELVPHIPYYKTAGITTGNTEQGSIKTGEKWNHEKLMSFVFRDWKDIYLPSRIPVLCYRAPFVTFSKNFGSRDLLEDLRHINRFFSLKTRQQTNILRNKSIYQILLSATPPAVLESKKSLWPYYLFTLQHILILFWESILLFFFLRCLPQALCFQWKLSLRIIKDIFLVAFSVPWTKLYSALRSVGNNQATLTIWNKMYNILTLDLPFFFSSQGTKSFQNSSQGVQASFI